MGLLVTPIGAGLEINISMDAIASIRKKILMNVDVVPW